MLYVSNFSSLRTPSIGLKIVTSSRIQSLLFMLDLFELIFSIKFDFLSKSVMKNIVEKSINILDGQLLEKKITISFNEKAKKHLMEKGYDQKFGARPLERLVQKVIKEPLADEILFGKLKKGGVVKVDYVNNEIKIKISSLP